jgi:hypothetical protein
MIVAEGFFPHFYTPKARQVGFSVQNSVTARLQPDRLPLRSVLLGSPGDARC